MKKVKSSSKKEASGKKIKDKKKRPSSYLVDQSLGARENGVYKFPGQFLLSGVLLILLWTVIEHPLGVMVLLLGILSLGLEVVFLSRRVKR